MRKKIVLPIEKTHSTGSGGFFRVGSFRVIGMIKILVIFFLFSSSLSYGPFNKCLEGNGIKPCSSFCFDRCLAPCLTLIRGKKQNRDEKCESSICQSCLTTRCCLTNKHFNGLWLRFG